MQLDSMTPRQIVDELDKYIVGQHKAKRAVAVALRNRVRRRKLRPEMAEEIQPKNILMIGTTGVGKTEIAPIVIATGLSSDNMVVDDFGSIVKR